ncbi:MAG TPA: ATP-binding protein [Candidatus Sulfomarinibacteraceae bacterium]|nr:ATP-binding protein [Candidatus Sulfomarinibacteraceae bacterium]
MQSHRSRKQFLSDILTPNNGHWARSLLYNLLLTLIGAVCIVSPLLVLARPSHVWFNVSLGATIGVVLVAFIYLAAQGHTTLVSYLLSFFVLVVITISVYHFGGVYSVNSAGYFLVLVVAGVLLSGRGVLFFGVGSLLSILYLYHLEAQGIVSYPPPTTDSVADLLALFTYMGLSALLLYVAVKNMNTAYTLLHSREQELKQAVRRLKSTTRAAHIAAAQAKEATRAKAEFLANMSHEIRTPLNAIVGMTDLMQRTELTPKQREYMQAVASSGDALLTLINDILDFSKIEAGKLDLEQSPFSLHDCLMEALNMLQEKADRKGLDLSLRIDSDVPPLIVADLARLRQVLVNLVGNAVKFTHEGSVSVSVEQIAAGDDGRQILQFAVADTGIGIPQKKLDLLFDSFSQVDASTTRQFGGTGLGLAICKRLVELMGGRIWVESEVQIGSTFYFTVPVRPHEVAPQLSDRREAQPRNGQQASRQSETFAEPKDAGFDHELAQRYPLQILVAEDNQVNQIVALRFLEQFGYEADVANNGVEALKAVENHHYDVILMDVQMPQLDGIQATQHILQQYSAEKRPFIVAMTAHALKGDRERLLELGMDLYLEKPVRPARLAEILESVGQKRRRQ